MELKAMEFYFLSLIIELPFGLGYHNNFFAAWEVSIVHGFYRRRHNNKCQFAAARFLVDHCR
ncbi:hypothetical protein, partial [Pseudomonas sp. F16(2018)]|uniref:hypothetical protein n=1 Tax=Pseudomonas sp. F16(2018) TaxID=2093746 RepID=UPI001C49A4DB